MEKLKIGISIGDINGIGLEIILKTLNHDRITQLCTPVVYGSSKVVSYHRNIVQVELDFRNTRGADRIADGALNLVNCWQETVNINLGRPTDLSGKYAFRSLEYATLDLKNGLIDALVTAPINKQAMQMADFPFPGHTEYLTRELGAEDSLMFMINDGLRVGLATNHLPLREVADAIQPDVLRRKIQIMHDSLRMDFGIEKPVIAVLGLNPHAGDQGVLGDEEETIIRPVIEEKKKKGMLVLGPYPADGFFGSGNHHKFDGILAMYHDQGLTAFKALSFGSGVNFTAGLPGVRTSPDHGTAYAIAGKNEADPASFRRALFAAIDIARQRKAYLSLSTDPVQKRAPKIRHDEVVED